MERERWQNSVNEGPRWRNRGDDERGAVPCAKMASRMGGERRGCPARSQRAGRDDDGPPCPQLSASVEWRASRGRRRPRSPGMRADHHSGATERRIGEGGGADGTGMRRVDRVCGGRSGRESRKGGRQGAAKLET